MPLSETFRRFSIDPSEYTPFETANAIWKHMEEHPSDDDDEEEEEEDVQEKANDD